MELTAPAGDAEKLAFVLSWGADAAYIGWQGLSLRAAAAGLETLSPAQVEELRQGGRKKIYVALNAVLMEDELPRLEAALEPLQDYPIDAVIISDLGALKPVRRYFPTVALHLSTQANCSNSSAASVYADLGFKRIVLAREVALDQVATIHARLPHLELELFAHGSMCLAFSGRCWLSRDLSGCGRSGNSGACTHSCRWNWKFSVQEEKRPGEYFDVEAGQGYTRIFSSRDLCLIDHLADIKAAGVHALKIEGRTKSVYYAALATQAYRGAIDALDAMGGGDGAMDGQWLTECRNRVWEIPHRRYSTGFLFPERHTNEPDDQGETRSYEFLGFVRPTSEAGLWLLDARANLAKGQNIEFVHPNAPVIKSADWLLLDSQREPVERVSAGNRQAVWYLKTSLPLEDRTILRTKLT